MSDKRTDVHDKAVFVDPMEEETPETISSTKLKEHNIDVPCNSQEEKDTPKGYSINDIDNLCDLIDGLCCPGCKKSGLSLSQAKKQGFAIKYVVSCVCGHNIDLWSSKKPPKVRTIEVNQRLVYAMRRCGKGYRGLKMFAALAGLLAPMSNSTYDKVMKNVHCAIKDVAKDIMKESANELCMQKDPDNSSVVDVGVSCDGTWQRRGFSSLNGAVAVISIDTGKILDVEVMSRYCNVC